jgi:hypothetical protein
MVDDEYDMYIEHIYSLLAANAADQEIADYLLWVELERMGMTGTPLKELLGIAAKLRSLLLPRLDKPGSLNQHGVQFQ